MRRLPAVVSPGRHDGRRAKRTCAVAPTVDRVTPELDVLRARLGDPAVWEPPGPELRGQVIAAVVSAAGPSSVPPRSRRWRWIAGAAAALIVVVVAASLVLMPDRADGADWDLTLYRQRVAPAAVVEVHGWNTANGTHLRVDVDGLAPAGPNEYYAIWMSSVSGQHVPAGHVPPVGSHRIVVGGLPGRLPTRLDHARARRRRRASHGFDDRRHAWLVTGRGASTPLLIVERPRTFSVSAP